MYNSKSTSPSPTQPRNGHGDGRRVSQRGLLSIAMLLVSMGALTIALLGAVRLIFDIFGEGLLNSLDGIGTKAVAIGLAYMVGWLTAMVAIRVYGNLVLPMLIGWFAWGCLAGVCVLYMLVLQRLYVQEYDMLRYWAYLIVVGAGLGAMVGLHLILENHDLRPFSIPLLIISLIQLGLIVFRYVFTADAKYNFIWKDLVFFFAMTAFSILMLAHLGMLEPLRNQFTHYFDLNSTSIRTED